MPQRTPDILVLHVVSVLRAVGGLELLLTRLLEWMKGSGIRHSIACLQGEAELRDRFDESVAIYCLKSRPNDIRLPWRLVRLLRRVRPTVISAYNWGAWPDVAVARLAAMPSVPLIFNFHGLDYTGKMPLRRRIACRILAEITTRLLTVSDASRQFLASATGIPGRRIGVIPNGIDVDYFEPACPGRPPEKRLIVGTAGSLKPIKNQAMLIRAVAELAAKGMDMELLIAGSGPDASCLAQLSRDLNADSHVQLVGHQEDVPAFLRRLDVFVLPSDTEAHPISLLEAMACGLPCVATRVGGVEEVLDGGRVGMLIDPGDQKALEDALARLAGRPELRAELGKAARQRVCERYSKDRMVDAYVRMYRDLSRRATRGR